MKGLFNVILIFKCYIIYLWIDNKDEIRFQIVV
jgi:hypothetical protein